MRDALDDALAKASEQQSQNWFDIRTGRFTASQMHRLIKSGKRYMTPDELSSHKKEFPKSQAKMTEDASKFSDDGETYILEKVAETLTGEVVGTPYSHATAWGEDLEPVAAEAFLKKNGFEGQIISFIPYGDHAGGSPDRIVNGNELLEIKCPYNSKNQINYLLLTDQYDLKNLFPEYYWQVMSNILFADAPLAHFVTYDHRFKEEKHQMSHLKVLPHKEDILLIKRKLDAAIKTKLDYLKSLA